MYEVILGLLFLTAIGVYVWYRVKKTPWQEEFTNTEKNPKPGIPDESYFEKE